ncbi:Dihydropteroate synthase [Poseidonocella pacifica]|uniref:Dihydropteroate synthase n=1 Tax=Poseidonocella pacifica TaxID=871651 RepID=A0A1I0VBF4_9RHOB|nr:dihydropteroate synthase [Poseidonocella pacifica]SFA72906.1 Dihydropteroate synthase [Poseidonocella pacifica]
MTVYFRPIPQSGPEAPDGALRLAGGWCWFSHVERLERGAAPVVLPAEDLPEDWQTRLTARRAPLMGVSFDRPRLMGILNVTPDSFSDGGRFLDPKNAMSQARTLIEGGADILDIGGESTRPGAVEVETEEEIRRTAPIITALRREIATPISIDTRKAPVARAALDAGADMVNDVAALLFDPELLSLVAETNVPLCLMHAQGDPATMQNAPDYDDVLLDVYDFLSERLEAAVAAGVPRHRIVVDPGIGFGKTQAHNLALLSRLSLFHGLGAPVLLGASRKRFIGTIGQAPVAADRMPGSIAVALAGVSQGAQILRVHDMKETRQALDLYRAAIGGTT